MADKYDPVPDLAKMLAAGIGYRTDVIAYADRISERLGLGEDDSAEVIAEVLRKALGPDVPQGDPAGTVMDLESRDPRTVTRDRDRLVIPRLRLDAEGCRVLRTIINNELADLASTPVETICTATPEQVSDRA